MTLFEQANKPAPFFSPKHAVLHEASFLQRSDEEQQKLADKVAKVMARKAGLEAYPGSVPYYFERNGDSYVAYFSMTSDPNLSFRVTFSLEDRSTKVVCVDLYKGIKEMDDPDITISISPNVNIVQLVNTVGDKMLSADATADDFEEVPGMIAEAYKYAEASKRIKEASKRDAVIEFLKTQGGDFTDYVRWATANNQPVGSQTMFNNARKVWQAQGGESPTVGGGAQSYQVGPAEPEEPLYHPDDADVFEDEAQGEAVEKFEEFEVMLREMAHASPNTWALFVYGSPGVGKSRSVKKIFQEEKAALERTGQKVVSKTGGIGGSTGLLQLLYDNKKNTILVLDDNDKILEDQTAANYLKGALNTEIEDRHVTYTRANLSALFAEDDEEEEEDIDEMPHLDADEGFLPDVEEARVHQDERGHVIFESASKRYDLGKANVQEAKKDEEGESIKDFYFRSRMIFISNLLKVPPAVDDRCYSIDMVFDYDQILALIETALDKIEIPNVDLEMRKEVLEFLRRNRWAIERKLGMQVILTFRKFRNACVAWETGKRHGIDMKTTKKWAMRQLRGAGGKKKR